MTADAQDAMLDDEPVHGSLREVVRLAVDASTDPGQWRVEADTEPEGTWTRVTRSDAAIPLQGWKLHISAYPRTATEILRRAVPVLIDEGVEFKLARSLTELRWLNEGDGGASQVGKFVTVYPVDDAQAVRLARALDAATRGLSAPAVPSDNRLPNHSVVHYRYGSFDGRLMQTPLGEIVSALVDPEGELQPDHRLTVFRPPGWVSDPFVAAGLAEPAIAAATLVVDQRYVAMHCLQRSPRGAVHLAADLQELRRCVLKSVSRQDVVPEGEGDESDRLRHEADALERLHAVGARVPKPLGFVEGDDTSWLVLEDIDGLTVEEHVLRQTGNGQPPGTQQVAEWGVGLATVLEQIHACGVIHRDVKTSNVMVARDGTVWLIDFDICQPWGDTSAPRGRGTRGYISPEQARGDPPTPADDVYAMGAVLYFMATAAEPSQAPRTDSLLDRPVRLLNPSIDPELARVIERCLDPDPSRRYRSPTMVRGQCERVRDQHERMRPRDPARGGDDTHADQFAAMAERLGHALHAAARPAPDGTSLLWRSTHPSGSSQSRDLNSGSAGALLVLAELAATFEHPAWRDTVKKGAEWLVHAPGLSRAPLPGLYVGEAGITAAILRAAQVLRDDDLMGAVAERSQWIASLPHVSPDLFNGTAGRLRFHLMVWDELHDPEHLAWAQQAGDFLLSCANPTPAGGLRWTIPAGYSGLSGQANLGYAHGAAGVADALLDLFEATDDQRLLDAAVSATRWISSQAVPVVDESGVAWPVNEGDGPTAPMWCHGASGIARLLLHLHQVTGDAPTKRLAEQAGWATARGARWASPTQCHGLSGNIELLLDLYQATGSRKHLREAQSLGQLLTAFTADRDGHLVFTSESPTVVSPDFMVGYAGVAACLLRLAEPEDRPHVLSRKGFRLQPRSRPATLNAGTA